MDGTSIGIIGFGEFGRFAAPLLARHATVFVADRRDIREEAARLGLASVATADAARSDVVVLAVPVAAMGDLLDEIGPALREDALVVDVASVKLKPMQLLSTRLPSSQDFVALHPLFGPQSGANGVEGLKVAVCGGRLPDERLDRVVRFLDETLRLRVLRTDPESHDRAMAYVQGLTHLIGWAFRDLEPPRTELSTLAYDRMLSLQDNVAFDSPELFATIERDNPFAREVREAFLRSLELICGCAADGAS